MGSCFGFQSKNNKKISGISCRGLDVDSIRRINDRYDQSYYGNARSRRPNIIREKIPGIHNRVARLDV